MRRRRGRPRRKSRYTATRRNRRTRRVRRRRRRGQRRHGWQCRRQRRRRGANRRRRRARDAAIADARDAGTTHPTWRARGAAGCGLANVLSKSYFDSIFPLANRNAVYTYEGLLAAAASYPDFANTGTLDACRKETAAFLANVARETGSLRYAEEIAKSVYCSTRTGCACDASTTDQSKWYYGRGAIQLTWNYNYCSAGTALSDRSAGATESGPHRRQIRLGDGALVLDDEQGRHRRRATTP